MKLRTLALSFVALLCTGCTAPVISGALTVAQYGTSTFNYGALEIYYPITVEQCVIAVRTTVNDLGLRPISDVPNEENEALYLKVLDEADQEIFFRVRRRARNLTSVSIRVGILGDEPYSNALAQHLTELLDPDGDPTTPPPDLRVPRVQRPAGAAGSRSQDPPTTPRPMTPQTPQRQRRQ